MKVLITGATGLIGSSLGRELAATGHELVVLVRDPARAKLNLPFPCEIHQWKQVTDPIPTGAMTGVEAVVHLAGEPIANERWTDERKRRIRDSRVVSTRALVDAILKSSVKPKVFVGGSAIGIYGNREDEEVVETSAAGADFLAQVCADWENELAPLKSHGGTRVVNLRTGIVVSENGGALEKMVPIFEKGLGGRVGNGQQWMSWIHLDDIVGLIRFALEADSVHGPLNGVAPNPVRNVDFTQELAKALGTIAIFPVPGLVLKAVFGEMAGMLLGGVKVSSSKAEFLGYRFRHPELGSALEGLLRSRREGFRVVVFEQWVPAPVEKVFPFFSDEKNLETITPPFLSFNVTGISTPEIQEGTLIDYRLKLHGAPIRWRTRIESWQPQRRFVDSQIKGPYETWHHTHEFVPLAGGTLMRDRVLYRLPFGWLGRLAAGFKVARDVRAIFAYRRLKIGELFF